MLKKKFFDNGEVYSEESLRVHLADLFNGIKDKVAKTGAFLRDKKKAERTIEEKLSQINEEWSDSGFVENLQWNEGKVKFGGKYPIEELDKIKPHIETIKKSLVVASRENKILVRRRAKVILSAIEFLAKGPDAVMSAPTISDFRGQLEFELGRLDMVARENRKLGETIAGVLVNIISKTTITRSSFAEKLVNNPYRLVEQDKAVIEFFEKKHEGEMDLLNAETFPKTVDFLKECIEVLDSYTGDPIDEWDKTLGKWFPISKKGEVGDFSEFTDMLERIGGSPKVPEEAKKEIKKLLDFVIMREVTFFTSNLWGRYNRHISYLERTIDRVYHLCSSSYK